MLALTSTSQNYVYIQVLIFYRYDRISAYDIM